MKTLRLDCVNQAEIVGFVADLLAPDVTDFGLCSAIGIRLGEELIAGVVYNNYFGRDIQASIGTTNKQWATRRTLSAIFAYPFLQLGCARITAQTRSHNLRAQLLLQRLGFRAEGELRHWYEDEHARVYGLLKAECIYL